MPVFRELAVGATDAALPGDIRPPGALWTGPRQSNAPMALDWYVVFVNTAGKVVTGGSAYIAWYGVEFAGELVNTPVAVASASYSALTMKRLVVGPGLYAWPIVQSQTPPTVPPKAVQVTFDDDGDGTYSIAVVGEEEPYEYEASGATLGDITTGLATLFSGHPTLTVSEAGEGFLLFHGADDFELVLSSPADSIDQTTYVDYSPPIEKMQIYTTASAGVEADVGFGLADVRTQVDAALSAAGSTSGDTYQQAKSAIADSVDRGVIPSKADINALAGPSGTRYAYGSSIEGVTLETQMVADGSTGYRVAILGWLATGKGITVEVELCSGAVSDTTSLSPAARLDVGAGSSIMLRPGSDPIWYSANDRGVVIKRGVNQPIKSIIFYKLVPNA